MSRFALIAIALALASCRANDAQEPQPSAASATSAEPDWQAIRGELAERVRVDQELREKLSFSGEPDMELFHEMERVDGENTARMKELVSSHGWPTIARVGKEGSHHAWLLVQHADRDVDFQEQCLALLADAVAAGEVDKKNLAYLEDRVAMHRGRPQRYGTQFVTSQDTPGRFVPHTLADPEHVDELRASVGLEPLAEYAARINAGH